MLVLLVYGNLNYNKKTQGDSMLDTLKTGATGVAGSSVYWFEWIPPLFSALAAFATLTYMLIKIYKEAKK